MTNLPRDHARRVRNDASRNTADNFKEPWTEDELAELHELWGNFPIEEIAEALGRTVEACRQIFYVKAKAKAERSVQRVDQWSKGFTEFPDDYW